MEMGWAKTFNRLRLRGFFNESTPVSEVGGTNQNTGRDVKKDWLSIPSVKYVVL